MRACVRACVRACRGPVFVILHVFTGKKKNSSANVNGVITRLENVQPRGNVLQVKKGICKDNVRCLCVSWNGADNELTALMLLVLEKTA